MTPDVTSQGPDWVDVARAWIDDDPDPGTQAEVRALLDDPAALAVRFDGRLVFGTAGLRGPVRAGPTGMNRAVVRRAAAGLAAHLVAAGGRGPVVVGRDARHGSEDFAADTCAVLAGAGLTPLLLPRPLPTPVLAFAVRHLGAAAGVMVTASHNPAADNGYKVYLADGAQLCAPFDAQVEAQIRSVGRVLALPLGTWSVLDEEVVEAYLEMARTVNRVPVAALPPRAALRWAYTPLHGVGLETMLAAVHRAGYPAPAVVAEQAEPDPDFPTVAFPNPEEPGAVDALLALMVATDADLGIASDPDADRVAVCLQGRLLTGDQVGVLLADHLIQHGVRGRFATTVVSSSMLGRLCQAHDLPYTETLTGFKHLAQAGQDLVFAYEEALGVCVAPSSVRDKDGISAAVLLLDLASCEKAGGMTLLDRLADLERQHGRHETRQLSYRVNDLSVISAAMRSLTEDPPSALGAWRVTSIEQPADDVLVYRLVGGRVVVRPSGTEPKLKAYLELVDPDPGDLDALAAAVDARLALA